MWRWGRACGVGTGFPLGCGVSTIIGLFYLVFCCVPTPGCGYPCFLGVGLLVVWLVFGFTSCFWLLVGVVWVWVWWFFCC